MWRSRRTARARFEVVMQPAFQETFSYTMTVWGFLGRELAVALRVRAFAMVNEMGSLKQRHSLLAFIPR